VDDVSLAQQQQQRQYNSSDDGGGGVVAAGQSSQLSPLTDSLLRHLVTVTERPSADHVLTTSPTASSDHTHYTTVDIGLHALAKINVL